jgi:site-specific recombinase XerD
MNESEYRVMVDVLLKIEERDAAVIGLMLFSGFRVSEVCALNVSDITERGFIRNSIYIPAAGNKNGIARHVDVPKPARELLERHLKNYFKVADVNNPELPVFITKKAKGRIQPRDVERWCEKITFEALGKKYHPHAFRHTFADRLLRISNIRVVQICLGHKYLNSTQIYTHPNSAECAGAVERAAG